MGLLFFFNSLSSHIDDYFPVKIQPSASNYGNTGILEMPNARFMEPASLRLNFSSSFPNEYTTLTASPFKWMEASYRYTELKNRLYGPSSYSGNQSLKDKGFDLKVRLLEEINFIPSVAIGMRDIAGTGLFSSEYIVSSKRFGRFDITAGLGWGQIATNGGYSNPFKTFNDSFEFRESLESFGGEFSYKSWFSGQTSIFGGVEYFYPKYKTRFKLEYDTSNPDARKSVSSVKSRFNLGASYFISDSLILNLAYERGDQVRVGFNLKGNFLSDTIKKPSPKNVLRLNKDQLETFKTNKSIFYRSLNRSLRDESIFIQSANLDDDKVDVAVASSKYFSGNRVAGRTARIVSALSPLNVERINVHLMNGDLETSIFSLDREELDKANSFRSSQNELLKVTEISSKSNKPLYKNSEYKPIVNFPEFSWNMSPSVKHQIGGPEGFYLGQLLWKTDTRIKFQRNLSLYTSFGINIYDTFSNLRNPSQSKIPHVRSDIQDYLEEGKNNIQRMQLEYMYSPYKDIFIRADVGLLEEMFAGYGGEILYRPFNNNFALGLTAHKVKQRDYDQRFSLKKYQTTTGHLSLYLDLPRQISSHIMVGKYLAGDKGVTLDLSRRFKTGFTLGVFATKTNLSTEEFGEGSFDKGFYFSVPVKLFYPDFRSGNISFGLHPLTKDGGAVLNHHHSLFGILGDSNLNSIQRDWDYFLN